MYIRSINNTQQKPQTTKQFTCRNIAQPAAALATTGSLLVMAKGLSKGHSTHMNILRRGLTDNSKYLKNIIEFGGKNLKFGAISFGLSALAYFASKYIQK